VQTIFRLLLDYFGLGVRGVSFYIFHLGLLGLWILRFVIGSANYFSFAFGLFGLGVKGVSFYIFHLGLLGLQISIALSLEVQIIFRF
jgi:hypothetical protein